jgi:hypothetical protein
MKLGKLFIFFRAISFLLLNFQRRRNAKFRLSENCFSHKHTHNMLSTKGTKEQIRGNQVLFQYLITNVNFVHKCCFFLSNLQKDYELKIYVFSLCFLLVPSTNSRDQKHAQKKAFPTTYNYLARASLPFNNLN